MGSLCYSRQLATFPVVPIPTVPEDDAILGRADHRGLFWNHHSLVLQGA